MAGSVKKYKKKNARAKIDQGEFRAIRVTARNYISAAKWAKGTPLDKVSANGDISNQRVKIGKYVAQIGDFIVRKVGEPTAFRVKDDVFEAEYQKI